MFKIFVQKDSISFETDLSTITTDSLIVLSQGLTDTFLRKVKGIFSDSLIQELLNNEDLDNFLLIVIDKKENSLRVYNDHFGSNEIYYTKNADGYIVAGDIKGLEQDNKTLNKNGLYESIIFQTVLPPETVFKNIYCIPSATVASFTVSSVSLMDYWNLFDLFAKKQNSYNQLITEGRNALLHTIKNTTDKYTATALSGGIDSGGLLGMYKETGKYTAPKVISIGPYGEGSGDLVSARKSAAYNQAQLTEIYPSFENFKFLWDLSVGLSQPVCLPIKFVHDLLHASAAEQSSQKIIYGLGAEMLLGNLKISRTAKALWFERFLPNGLLRFLYKHIGFLFIKSDSQKHFLSAVGDWTDRFMVVRGPYFSSLSAYFKGDANDFWIQVKTKMEKHFDSNLDIYDAFVKMYVKSWVNYLQYRDMTILGRLYGITPVIPFDSIRLAKIFFSVPLKHRSRNKWNKQLIRDIMKPFVADHLYSNQVKSLIVPYSKFFEGKELEIIEYVKTSVATSQLFDYDQLLKEYEKLPANGYILMHILGVAVWYDANFAPERKIMFEKIFK